VQRIDGQRMRPDEAFLHRVERRGTDIAIDHADRAEHQGGQRMAAIPVGRIAGRGGIVDETGHDAAMWGQAA
jgi:regulation of enolase protein 1 (concanavalin A-like superfamily)